MYQVKKSVMNKKRKRKAAEGTEDAGDGVGNQTNIRITSPIREDNGTGYKVTESTLDQPCWHFNHTMKIYQPLIHRENLRNFLYATTGLNS